MLVVMEQGATDAQIKDVVDKLKEMKFKVDRVDGVEKKLTFGFVRFQK